MFKPISKTIQGMIIELYEKGYSQYKIAEELMIDRITVNKYLVREGLVEVDPEVVEQGRTRYTQEERDFAVELYQSGMSAPEVSEITGMSVPTILNHVKKAGGLRKTTQEDINKAIQMYDRDQYSVQEILDKTGVPRTTFYKHLNKHKQGS